MRENKASYIIKYKCRYPKLNSHYQSMNQSSLFAKQNVNKITKAISSIDDESDIANLHDKCIYNAL